MFGRVRRFLFLPACWATTGLTSLALRQDVHAQQLENAVRFETQDLPFEPVLYEGYGCYTMRLELPEPIDLTGVDNVGLDGIQIVLDHPAQGFDLIRYSIALFAEGVAQPLSGHGSGFQLLPGEFEVAVPFAVS